MKRFNPNQSITQQILASKLINSVKSSGERPKLRSCVALPGKGVVQASYAYSGQGGNHPLVRRYSMPIAKSVFFDHPNDENDCPFPLEVIPNYMGINLCAVESIDWSVGPNEQLIDITIHFNSDAEAMLEELGDVNPTTGESIPQAVKDYYTGLASGDLGEY